MPALPSFLRRSLRMAVRILGSLLLLAVLAVAFSLGMESIDRTDDFHVAHAALADPHFLVRTPPPHDLATAPDAALAVHAHRLAQGAGTIFGHRFYSNGSPLIIDDEDFEKVTVWIPDEAPARVLDIDLGDERHAIAVVTAGGSAWPDRACGGIVTRGHLRVEPATSLFGERRYHIQVRGAITGRGFQPQEDYCPATIERRFETSPLTFAQLTPWLGLAGPEPYDETYRN